MTEAIQSYSQLIALVGAAVLAALLARSLMSQLGLPAFTGYVAVGLTLGLLHQKLGILPIEVDVGFGFLAQLGVIAILFKVGLESDLGLLVEKLAAAVAVWAPDIVVSGALCFALVYFWPGYGTSAAAFAGIAATATSIGVSTAIWEDAGALKTDQGALLIDVAELDDVSGVLLMSLLFAVAPILAGADIGSVWPQVLKIAGYNFALLVVFCAGCYLFSRHVERPLTAWFAERNPKAGALLFATASGLLIAAIADSAGFSVAIGALFAGLAFSRDPAERDIDRAFAGLHAFLSPFFFIGIGMSVDVTALMDGLVLGIGLFVAAAAGKVIGAGLPAAFLFGSRGGLLIGASMVPRAEIFLIIMAQGAAMGPAAVPASLFAAAVFVSLASCVLAPIVVQRLLASDPGLERAA